MKNFEALAELLRVRGLVAFTVGPEAIRKRLNQYSVKYKFPDGSYMQLNTYSGYGYAWKGAFTRRYETPIRVNKSS